MAYQPKSYRKFLAGTISAAVVASAVAPAASAAEVKFPDLAGLDQETTAAIEALVGLGVIVGQPDGKFAPNKTINRGQAAEMIVKALPNVEPKANPTGKVFEDLTEKSYSSKFAEALVDAGLYPAGGKFEAGKGMTREQMAVTLVSAFGLKNTGAAVEIKDLDKAAEASRAAITILAQNGLTKLLDGNFNPTADVTRSQFALFFYRAVSVATAVEVVEVKSTSNTTLEVKVKGSLTKVAPTDFTFDGGLTVTAAEIVPAAAADTFTTVKLTTSAQEAGKSYKLLTSFGKEVKTEVKFDGVAAAVATSVSALSNNKVKVSFDKALTVAPAASTFVIKDAAGAALNVTDVKLSADGKSVVLTTAAQTAYALYTFTAGEFAGNFVGLKADTTKPTATALVKANTIVEVAFNEAVDATTATNIANYTVDNGLTVLKAVLSADGKTVKLTTSEQTVGTIYKVTVQNVADVTGNVMDKYETLFGGYAKDTTKPKATALVKGNTTVEVSYDEAVTKEVAENIANYTVDNGLTVLKAELDEETNKVTLTTSEQVVGTIYKITVQNVTDLSGNVMEKTEALFGGYAKDTTKPAAPAVYVTDYNKVTVTFAEAMDKTVAENIANYTLNNNLTVVKAELNTAKTVVTLTTSEQVVGTIYKLTVENLTDIAGNKMDKAESLFGGRAKDTSKPTASVASAAGTVTVTFSEAVSDATAKNLANYVFDGGLGYATKATLSEDKLSVVLETATQTPGKIYNVTLNNIADANGNVIEKDTKLTFVGKGTVAAASVTAQTVSIVNNNTIDLVFDKELTSTQVAALTVAIDSVTTTTHAGLEYKALQQSDKKVVRVQFKTTASSNPALFDAGKVYEATIDGVSGLVKTSSANVKKFAGTNVSNAAPVVETATALNKTALKVTFSEPVTGVVAGAFAIAGNTVTGVSVDPDAVVTEAILYLGTELSVSSVYDLTFVTGVKDAAGFADWKTKNADNTAYTVKFAGTNVANSAPKISAIVPVDKYTFDIVFSEAVINAAAATYAVQKTSGTVADLDLTGAKLTASADKTKVTVQLDSSKASLASGNVYQLTYTGDVKDLQGVAYDTTTNANKVSFAGTDVANAAPTVAAIEKVDGDTIKVTFSENIDWDASAETAVGSYAIYNKGTTTVPSGLVITAANVAGTSKNAVEIHFTGTLNASAIYDLKVLGVIKDYNQISLDNTKAYNFTHVSE
jgi:trimeric autotransporter adhesin